jgi:predicted transcriptional regulator
MMREAVLLAVRPTFAARILAGTKTVELRRVRPKVYPGQDILIYSSSPTMALLASAVVERVETDEPEQLWPRVKRAAGLTKAEYTAYFVGAGVGSAIWIRNVAPLVEPVGLREMRARWPWFRPPQSYCFVRVGFGAKSGKVKSLAPRSVVPDIARPT